jgi:hypothetical protein
MKWLAADDPVRVVRTIFRELEDQAIDQAITQKKGWVIVKERVKVLGGVRISTTIIQ